MTENEIKEQALSCALSPILFLEHCSILNPKGGKIPFILWPFQKDLLGEFTDNRLLILLKARQMGVTWTALGFGLWDAIFHEGANVLLISEKQDLAVKLLDKVKFLYHSLPWWLQPTISKDNTTTLAFGALSSKIEAYPSVAISGRSETSSLVICDEWALHPFAEENYLSYKPTIDAGGKMIGISTANGLGGFYYDMWQAAQEGSNGFFPVFLPWFLHPDRDSEWYEKTKKEYSATSMLRAKFYQEYCATPEEAFVALENCIFDLELVKRMFARTMEPIEVKDGLRIWKHPSPEKTYVMGCDVSEGIGLNYSGVCVLDRQTREHIADWHGQISPDLFANVLAKIGHQHNDALLGVENNNHGHTVLNVLSNYLGYPNLYYHQEYDHWGKKSNRRLGWTTSHVSKPIMIDDFVAATAQGDFITWDRSLIEEMRTFSRHPDSSVHAIPGAYDDRVIKAMIALQMCKYSSFTNSGRPAHYVIGGGV